MEPDKINQYIEVQKTVFDYIKHITTLNTGSIVLLASLLEKIFPNPVWKIFIMISFSCFVLSVMLLTLCGFAIIYSMRIPEQITPRLVNFTALTFIFGMITFVVALSSLAAFTMRNLL